MNMEELEWYALRPRSRDYTRLEEFHADLRTVRDEYARIGDHVSAKKTWILGMMVYIQIKFRNAFAHIMLEEYYSAWCDLCDCDTGLDTLHRHHIIDHRGKLGFIAEQVPHFQSLFPYTRFMSPEIVYKGHRCTICGKEVALNRNCGHDIGQIYDGMLCGRTPTEVLTATGVAITETPKDKKCVLFHISASTGEKVDKYNYYPVKGAAHVLSDPYTKWRPEFSKKRQPHYLFAEFDPQGKCPCDSGRKYRNCCLKHEGVLVTNIRILIHEKGPREIEIPPDGMVPSPSFLDDTIPGQFTGMILSTE